MKLNKKYNKKNPKQTTIKKIRIEFNIKKN
jgi:hypothetical protein